jgi:hypothetical protein
MNHSLYHESRLCLRSAIRDTSSCPPPAPQQYPCAHIQSACAGVWESGFEQTKQTRYDMFLSVVSQFQL